MYTTRRIIALTLTCLLLAGCGAATPAATPAAPEAQIVRTQSVADSALLALHLTYPATVVADQEAKIIARSAGTARAIAFTLGDTIHTGQMLLHIDDATTTSSGNNQISQMQNAVDQANNAVTQARNNAAQADDALTAATQNYTDTLASTTHDLQDADITRSRSQSSSINTDATTAASQKSAELAHDNAVVAVEQAELALDNKKQLAAEAQADTETTATTTAQSVGASISIAQNGINDLFNYSESSAITLPYAQNLGALNIQTFTDAKNAYKDARAAYATYQSQSFTSITGRITALQTVLTSAKSAVDTSWLMLESTSASANLPLTSSAGPSLTSLRATVSGYQISMNSGLTTLSATSQALTDIVLQNTTALSGLQKSLDLAKKSEAIAAQAIASTTAGNTTQQSQAEYTLKSSNNAYESAKIRANTQITASNNALTSARTAATNAHLAQKSAEENLDTARLNLQLAQENHDITSPLDGIITDKQVTEGASVTLGQVLGTISHATTTKVQFYVEPDQHDRLTLGMPLTQTTADGTILPATISAIAPQADPVTRRFLIEARPTGGDLPPVGTILTATLTLTSTADSGALYVPLAALSVTQTATTLYIDDNSIAKQIPATLIRVEGEYAEVHIDAPQSAQIIIEGNKFLRDNMPVQTAPTTH